MGARPVGAVGRESVLDCLGKDYRQGTEGEGERNALVTVWEEMLDLLQHDMFRHPAIAAEDSEMIEKSENH